MLARNMRWKCNGLKISQRSAELPDRTGGSQMPGYVEAELPDRTGGSEIPGYVEAELPDRTGGSEIPDYVEEEKQLV